ncbi:MAG: putative transcriptional regulator, TetR family [Acidimicrobiia bacterium]|nr:putative transcriptional regulator, TetR family [Acidimicrobiia bacterium]
MIDGALGLRAQQRRATTLKLESIALDLFSQHGYYNVTTAQISEAAGVSHRTFFRHFPGGKDDVLLAEHRDGLAEVAAELLRRPPHEDVLTAMRASMGRMVTTLEQEDNVERALQRRKIIADSPALRGRAVSELMDRQEALIHLVAMRMSVDPSCDLRPALVVGCYLTAVQVAFMSVINGNHETVEELCSRALDMVDQGLRSAVDLAATAS